MVVKSFKKLIKKIKFCLVFFSFLFFISCNTIDKKAYSFKYKDSKIASICFINANKNEYTIVLKGKENPILGDYIKKQDTLVFTPAIPFTQGNTYQIIKNNTVLKEFKIPEIVTKENVELLQIYPVTDTVPENLLKMYFVFSKPMQEVKNALDFISVIDKKTQKEIPIFLKLETELWNTKHTELTLWLDPGRIKKELIPNKTLGKPLQDGNTYFIQIDKNWSDYQGNTLKKNYSKTLYVTKKDVLKPNEKLINVISAKPQTKDAISIQFNQQIDVMLVDKNITILDDKRNRVEGKFTLNNNKSVTFAPINSWKKGNYILQINTNLEDLAGNTFNRLFDTDLENNTTTTKEFSLLKFTVQ